MENPKICVNGVDGEEMDKYTADIELSNICRNVYVSRLKAAELVRKKLLETPVIEKATENGEDPEMTGLKDSDNRHHNHRKTSIDQAMAVLKREMATLIDQDLTLMKQLLTLNEQIEELKWRRSYCNSCSRSSLASSTNMCSSVGTLSDAELDNVPVPYLPRKYHAPSPLSICRNDFRSNSMDTLLSVKANSLSTAGKLSSSVSGVGGFRNSIPKCHSFQNGNDKIFIRQRYDSDHLETPTGSTPHMSTGLRVNGNSYMCNNNINGISDDADSKLYNGEQQSFDSGIHEPELVFDIEMNNATESTRL